MSSSPLFVPLSLFGGFVGEPPTQAAIRVARLDALERLTGGAVLDAGTFEWPDDERLLPVEFGLYGEATFGPIPRTDNGSADLSAYGAPTFSRRPQIRRAGRIDLAAPPLHPWVVRFRPEVVDQAVGLPRERWLSVLAGHWALSPAGELLPVESHRAEPADEWRFGREALYVLARDQKRGLDVPAMRVLPVLPAGLRPATLQGDRVLVRDATLLYRHLMEANVAARDCLEGSASVGEKARAHVSVSRAVEALFFDGLDRDGHNAASPSAVALQPLAAPLFSAFGANSIADLTRVTDFESLVLTLRGPLFIFRALVEANGLEIVPLDARGEVDETAHQQSMADRTANVFQEVYGEQLGAAWGRNVMHGPTEPPHIDVHAFLPQGQGEPALLVTAGMSAVPMAAAVSHADPFIELVCHVPLDLDEPSREAMMRTLLMLARHPARKNTFFAERHTIALGEPFTPGSSLDCVVFEACEAPWVERVSFALPRYPSFLRAIGISSEERQLCNREGFGVLRERLTAGGAWQVTDPRRRV